MIVFPNCKINLGLHILQKRTDGFHNLETIFYPLPFQDALEVIQNKNNSPELNFSSSGLPIQGEPNENICYKAYYLLKEKYPQLPSIKMHLHKVIPMGAGLGGGSADGAFTLLLLNKKFNLELSEEELIQYALQLGSDCPFFLKNQPCYANGRGELLQSIPLDLSSYKILLINPGIHINTGWAFSQITPTSNRVSLKESINLPIAKWKEEIRNDFEEPISIAHPEIGQVKELLYKKGALYASMTGSGSTLFGIFEKHISIDLDLPQHYFIKEV